MRQRLVLVGNGMAGMKTLETLRGLAPERYDITVFGAEPHGNYNRIQLSPVLAGEKSFADIMLHTSRWYAEHDIRVHLGTAVAEIDRDRQRVIAADGTVAAYDRLLLATGSNPVVLPVPGHGLPGVVTYRDIHDVRTMLAAARRRQRAVVIGGGLLGLEAAYGLRQQGMSVTVVHLLDTLMERQLDRTAAALLQRSLEARGLRFRLGAQTAAILGRDRVSAVRFADGNEEPADLVVMAAGIRPNTGLAQAAGLHCERGVVVSDGLRSSDPHIYAVGECAQHRGQCYGLVAPLYEQAAVCAAQLAGRADAAYAGSLVSTRLKVTGIDVFSAGDFHGKEGCEELIYQDPDAGVYKKLVLEAGRIRGAVLLGDAADAGWYLRLMQEAIDIGAARERLIFGRAAVEAGARAVA